MTSRRLILAAIIAAGAALASAVLSPHLDPVEDRITALRYAVAGPQPADTNVIIIYLENDAIASLGWPVPRSFYALMVRALADLDARAVGIEVLFEQTASEFPEYDTLLASVAGTAGTVVTAGYLGAFARDEEGSSAALPAGSRYPGVREVHGLGSELHLPFPLLAGRSAGIGHLNLSDRNAVPLFISTGTEVLPSWGMELLRVAARAERAAVRTDGSAAVIAGPERKFTVPYTGEGVAEVRLPAGPRAFRTYRFLEVLKAYDALRLGGTPALPVASFRGKIVLVGIIGEGRSTFLATPGAERFPSLLYHASFLDNALRGRFLTRTPLWLLVVACGLAALACSTAVFLLRPPWSVLAGWSVPVASGVLSLLLFTRAALMLPLAPILVAAALSAITAILFKHRTVRAQVGTLQSEKAAITNDLRDREAKLAVLERELLQAQASSAADRTDELLEEIRRYKAEIRTLSSQADDLEEYRPENGGAGQTEAVFEQIVYSRGGAMAAVVEFVSKIAESDAPVLVLGESGTGKELVARAMHRRSARRDRPFVAVNCGALAESLLESELFGHEKGAFTGAVKEKPGRFEQADGGTVFLDEIGEVSENFQVKLLRVLQEGELERVGGTRTLRVDVRVLAATNKDLKEQVRRRKFREDLYYRLNVLAVEIPPLRERREDIPLLFRHFLGREGGALAVSKNVMDAAGVYDWPGNVRELESAVKRAALLANAERRTMITMKEMTDDIASAAQGTARLEDQVLELVRKKGFSRSAVTETAMELGGLNRGTVAEYLRGECLKALVDHGFDLDESVRYLSFSSDPDVYDRVKKRLREYLDNIGEAIDTSQPWESAKVNLRSKMKNLPRRYHEHLELVAEAYFRGRLKEKE